MSEQDDHVIAEAMAPPRKPTEAVIGPVYLAVRRSWPYDKHPADGAWYAQLDAGPVRRVWTCGHQHPDLDSAWRCAQHALTLLAIQGLDPNDYQWDES